ncbi:Flp family type IVb pilin [Caulobacter endophyticus]|uniref:Flp family type IVb pilin n=1 Tax=Caulobacter endophyticus TaxID=2172652 RepID=A0A2T9JKW6_9CAUL|nr:Flp family type IVb pilin [Caulobacter endophyticus]PVM84339.1 Flp family type IVb pilin [Caulobacter endophyticus]
MGTLFDRFLKDERGATVVEYGLIACFVSIMVVAAVPLLGPSIQGAFERVRDHLNAAGK